MDKLVAKADAAPIDKAVPDYQAAGKIMVDDQVQANLEYGTQAYFAQSYLKGQGYNSLYDYNWEGISILKH